MAGEGPGPDKPNFAQGAPMRKNPKKTKTKNMKAKAKAPLAAVTAEVIPQRVDMVDVVDRVAAKATAIVADHRETPESRALAADILALAQRVRAGEHLRAPDPKRSAAARRAWDTIRANRAAKEKTANASHASH